MAITITRDSATISTTEYFLASDSTTAVYQATDTNLQVQLDLGALAPGDQYEIKIYDKTDGTNPEVIYHAYAQGAQPYVWVSPPFTVGDWEVSVKKLAGTDRAIGWALVKITA